MREHKFETIEHTADVGVTGKGASLAEAFESAAYGMFSVMADLNKYQPTGKTTVQASGADLVELLQSFLSELIVLFESEQVLCLDFEIREFEDMHLVCEVSHRPVGDDIEWLGPSVKAVTYHEMAVEKSGGQWLAKVIFDV